MGEIVKFRKASLFPRKDRTSKVTLCSLALAIEYYTDVVPNPEFVAEARACLRGYETAGNPNVVMVTLDVYKAINFEMKIQKAIDKCLLG